MTKPYLGDPKNTIEILKKYDFVFQKRFGQNFLIDTHAVSYTHLSLRLYENSQIMMSQFKQMIS